MSQNRHKCFHVKASVFQIKFHSLYSYLCKSTESFRRQWRCSRCPGPLTPLSHNKPPQNNKRKKAVFPSACYEGEEEPHLFPSQIVPKPARAE